MKRQREREKREREKKKTRRKKIINQKERKGVGSKKKTNNDEN